MSQQTPAATTVDGLMAAAFNRPRSPRSQAYKDGCRAHLLFKIDGIKKTPLPFESGTSEADAFFAGEDEGRRIYCRLLEEAQIA